MAGQWEMAEEASAIKPVSCLRQHPAIQFAVIGEQVQSLILTGNIEQLAAVFQDQPEYVAGDVAANVEAVQARRGSACELFAKEGQRDRPTLNAGQSVRGTQGSLGQSATGGMGAHFHNFTQERCLGQCPVIVGMLLPEARYTSMEVTAEVDFPKPRHHTPGGESYLVRFVKALAGWPAGVETGELVEQVAGFLLGWVETRHHQLRQRQRLVRPFMVLPTVECERAARSGVKTMEVDGVGLKRAKPLLLK